jgi:hypothetical protein
VFLSVTTHALAQDSDDVAAPAQIPAPIEQAPAAKTPAPAAADESQTPEKPVILTAVHPHRQQRDHYLFGTFGPPGLISAALSAGLNQWRNVPSEWEQERKGYAKRFGAAYGGGAIENTTMYVVARILDEDPSFRPCRCAGVLPRLRHATLGPFLARKPDGHTVFSLARVGGIATRTTIAASTWQPEHQSLGGQAKNVAVSLAGTIGTDILREFFLHRRGSVPD